MDTQHTFTIEQLETIERYLDHTMDAGEKVQFEAQLAKDTSLQEKVAEIRFLIETVETAALKSKLERFHESIKDSKTPIIDAPKRTLIRRRSKSSIYAIAAILVVAFGLLYFMNAETSTEKLFAKHFIPDPGLPTTMSNTSNFDFYDAMVNYKRAEYDLAIAKWEKLLREKPQNDSLQYFLGVSYLAKGNSSLAEEYLQKLSNQPNSIFTNDAIFYRALALLKSGKAEQATQLLKANPSDRNAELLLDIK